MKTDRAAPEAPGGTPVDQRVGRLVDDQAGTGPRGTYGCACVSRDSRECTARRYPRLPIGPQPDDSDEYSYLHAECCQCLCHEWSDEDDDLG